MYSAEYLQPNAESIKKVLSEVWQKTTGNEAVRVTSRSGCVFVEGRGGRSLTVITTPSPQQLATVCSENDVFHLDLSDNPLVTVVFPHDDRSAFICVHCDGLLRLYCWDQSTGSWYVEYETRLIREGRIISATLHPAHSALYWCQTVTSGDATSGEVTSGEVTSGDVTSRDAISEGVTSRGVTSEVTSGDVTSDIMSDGVTSNTTIPGGLTPDVTSNHGTPRAHTMTSQRDGGTLRLDSEKVVSPSSGMASLWYASLLQDGASLTLSAGHLLVTDCPPCSLHLTGDQLLLHLSEPCPPGVYVVWRQTSRTVCLCVPSRGAVVSARVYSAPANFHQMALQAAPSWTQCAPVSGWARVEGGERGGEAWFVDVDGGVWAVGSTGLASLVCHLASWRQEGEVRPHCVRHPAGLLVATGNSLRVYSVITGELLNTLSLDLAVCGTWICATSGNGGLTTAHGLLQVSCGSLPHRASSGCLGSRHHLLTSMAAATHKVAQSSVTSDPTLRRLQSPALLLAARHQSRDAGDVTALSRLQQPSHCECYDPRDRPETRLTTKLHTSLDELVQKFAALERLQWTPPDHGETGVSHGQRQLDITTDSDHLCNHNGETGGRASLDHEVCRLLPPTGDLCQHYVYFKVVLLATQWPCEMSHAVLARCGLDPRERVPYSEGVWAYLRSQRATDVLTALTRLLYTTRPQQLLPFLERLVSSNHDDTPAFTTPTQAPVYRRLLPHLPSPRHSAHKEGATVALARITLRSGSEDCKQKSLQLLIQSELWGEAVQLLEELPPADSALPGLYWAVLTAASQTGSLPAVRTALLDLAPTDLSVVSLLHQLLPDVPLDGRVTHDMPIGPVVDYLHRNHHLLAK